MRILTSLGIACICFNIEGFLIIVGHISPFFAQLSVVPSLSGVVSVGAASS